MFARGTFKGVTRYMEIFTIRSYPSEPGSGAGKGGGAGGSIRESGGGLGRLGVANEEGYFYKKQREILEKMKNTLDKTEEKGGVEQKKEP